VSHFININVGCFSVLITGRRLPLGPYIKAEPFVLHRTSPRSPSLLSASKCRLH
jgi:hypothetical protein